MSPKFRIEAITPDAARDFWQDCPQASAFTQPDILARCAERVDWWGAWRSDDLVATWPVCFPDVETTPRSPTFLYYVGPLFSAEIQQFKYHRYQAIRQQALETLIAFLIERYSGLGFALPPGQTDIRAFDWWNHEHPELAGFQIRPRQTARIDDLGRSAEALHSDFARNRKRDLRQDMEAVLLPAKDWKIGELIELHNQPFQRQDLDLCPNRMQALKSVIAAASDNGTVLAWRDQENGQLACAIVLLYGKTDANNILCVAADPWRERGLSAWTTWQGIQRARADGKKIFDFNGANSPQRAADKHSYGAQAELYFNITLPGQPKRRLSHQHVR